jgi:outer membrane protein assembly factor BamB
VLGSDGTIYIAGLVESSSPEESTSSLFAVSPTGTLLWQFDGEPLVEPVIGPNNLVYVRGDYMRGAGTHGLDPATGEPRWSIDTSGVEQNPPAIAADGTVYLPFDDDGIVAVDAHGEYAGAFEDYVGDVAITSGDLLIISDVTGCLRGLDRSGEEQWQVPIPDGIIPYVLLLQDDSLAVATWAGNLFYIASTGEVIWSRMVEGGCATAPVLGLIDGSEVLIVGTREGTVVAIDLAGATRWSVRIGDEAIAYWGLAAGADGTCAVVHGGRQFTMPAQDGSVRTLVEDGRQITLITPNGQCAWTVQEASACYAPAVGADGTVYYGTASGTLVARRRDGTVTWRCAPAVGSAVVPDPAIGPAGSVRVLHEDGTLVAYTTDGTELGARMLGFRFAENLVAAPDGSMVYIFEDQKVLRAVDLAGETRWTRRFEPGGILHPVVVGSDGAVYVANKAGLTKLLPDGATAWVFEPCEGGPVAVRSDGILAVQGKDGQLYVLQPDRTPIAGHRGWHTGRGGGIRPVFASDGSILTLNHDLGLNALSADGAVRWTFGGVPEGYQGVWGEHDEVRAEPVVAPDGSIYVLSAHNPVAYNYVYSVHRLDHHGVELWRVRLRTDYSKNDFIGFTVCPQGIAVASGRDVVAITPLGTLAWAVTVTGGAVCTNPVFDGESRMYIGTRSGYLHAFDWRACAPAGRTAQPSPLLDQQIWAKGFSPSILQ